MSRAFPAPGHGARRPGPTDLAAPLPGRAPQPQPEAAEPDLPGSDAASAEATTKDGLKIGNGSLRLRQDDPGPTWESRCAIPA